MKQMTQKEFIELIREKQENAKNTIEAIKREEKWTLEDGQDNVLRLERNRAYVDAYNDLLCYLFGVEIVPERIEANKGQFVGGNYPEEEIVTTIPKAKQEELGLTQEDLKEMIKNAPIKPYNEPQTCYNCADYLKCKENNIACNGSGWMPLRDDRFREFEAVMSDCVTYKDMIDARCVTFIRFVKSNKEYSIEIWCGFGYATNKKFTEEAQAKAYYQDLVEWWKYWKIRG